jgi:hypothetical protein
VRRIPIKLGSQRDGESIDIKEEALLSIERDNRWRIGTALINGVSRQVERRKQLDGYAYRYNGIILDPSCIEAYRPDEYQEWRDE